MIFFVLNSFQNVSDGQKRETSVCTTVNYYDCPGHGYVFSLPTTRGASVRFPVSFPHSGPRSFQGVSQSLVPCPCWGYPSLWCNVPSGGIPGTGPLAWTGISRPRSFQGVPSGQDWSALLRRTGVPPSQDWGTPRAGYVADVRLVRLPAEGLFCSLT